MVGVEGFEKSFEEGMGMRESCYRRIERLLTIKSSECRQAVVWTVQRLLKMLLGLNLMVERYEVIRVRTDSRRDETE